VKTNLTPTCESHTGLSRHPTTGCEANWTIFRTVTKCVNICLAPIKTLVWGYEKIESFISERVSEKLKNVPPENITTPKPEIAGPAVEALRYVGHVEELRELYANLLANAMDKSTIKEIHPAFVEVVKNMTPEEASILKLFDPIVSQYPIVHVKSTQKDGNAYQIAFRNFSLFYRMLKVGVNDVPTFLDNLCRLNILEIPSGVYINDEKEYEPLMEDSKLTKLKKVIMESDKKVEFDKSLVRLTSLGRRFVRMVVLDKK
jgi:Abortive infection alpha